MQRETSHASVTSKLVFRFAMDKYSDSLQALGESKQPDGLRRSATKRNSNCGNALALHKFGPVDGLAVESGATFKVG